MIQPDVEVQLRVVLRALREVIIPAIDPSNRPALEQAALSSALVELIADRLPHLGALRRRELTTLVEVAEALMEDTPPEAREALGSATATARAVLDRPGADMRPVADAEQALSTRLCQAIATAAAAGPECYAIVQRKTLATMRRQTLLGRAWFATTGLDPAPNTLPSLEELIYV